MINQGTIYINTTALSVFFFNKVGENQSRFSLFEALELVSDQRSQHNIASETQNLIDFTPLYRLIKTKIANPGSNKITKSAKGGKIYEILGFRMLYCVKTSGLIQVLELLKS